MWLYGFLIFSMSMHPVLFWIGFHVLLGVLLAIDFAIFQRRRAAASMKHAWGLSAFWVLIALAFNYFVYISEGSEAGLQFFTSYLVEKSLSIDNLFVFLWLFTHYQIAEKYQHKILFWGIFGAIVFRILFILVGLELLNTLHWMAYILGGFLCFTAFKMLMQQEKGFHANQNILVRAFRTWLPLARNDSGDQFFIREGNHLKMTRLFLVLLMIESADILFALDSIPAVLAITRDPFIAYTSNIFAILGLRALYFVVNAYLKKFKHLTWGLAGVLFFVGIKMLLQDVYHISNLFSLGIIVLILGTTMIISWVLTRKNLFRN